MVDRAPAAKRPHPAATLPSRDAVLSGTAPPAPRTDAHEQSGEEKYSDQLNVRLRPSTIRRLTAALDKLPRSEHKQSVVDKAINEYIDRLNLD